MKKSTIPGEVWASRESRQDKEPPALFYAQVVKRLEEAFPGAELSEATLEKLKPFLIKAWRTGFNAKQAAAAHCACEDNQIVPSPGTKVELEKGEVFAPRGAGRGQLFPPEQLRPAVNVQRKQRELQVELEAAIKAERKATEFRGKVEATSGTRSEGYLAKWRSQMEKRAEHLKVAATLRENLDARSLQQVLLRLPEEARAPDYGLLIPDAPKPAERSRGRKPKGTQDAASAAAAPAEKKKPGRKPKAAADAAAAPAAPAEKKKPGRKPKAAADAAAGAGVSTEKKKPGRKPKATADKAPGSAAAPVEKKKPGRKPKVKEEPVKPAPSNPPPPPPAEAPPDDYTPERVEQFGQYMKGQLKDVLDQYLGKKG